MANGGGGVRRESKGGREGGIERAKPLLPRQFVLQVGGVRVCLCLSVRCVRGAQARRRVRKCVGLYDGGVGPSATTPIHYRAQTNEKCYPNNQ